jgi:hemoglobin
MKDLQNRADVRLLVERFYEKIKLDPVLGPVFLEIVTNWELHLERLTDFWESQLFLKRSYIGNPLAVHQHVDDRINHTITPRHFGLWLNLWYETLDELFSGETAAIAKTRAQKMSTMFYLKIYENRKK